MESIQSPLQSKGVLVLQTVAMPKDANASGDIFGGWLLSQMDLGGAVLAHKLAQNRVTTVALNGMTFLKPVYIGDLVCCYATVVKTGRSSISIRLDVWVDRMSTDESIHVTEGIITYVAIDEQGKSKPVQWPD